MSDIYPGIFEYPIDETLLFHCAVPGVIKIPHNLSKTIARKVIFNYVNIRNNIKQSHK